MPVTITGKRQSLLIVKRTGAVNKMTINKFLGLYAIRNIEQKREVLLSGYHGELTWHGVHYYFKHGDRTARNDIRNLLKLVDAETHEEETLSQFVEIK